MSVLNEVSAVCRLLLEVYNTLKYAPEKIWRAQEVVVKVQTRLTTIVREDLSIPTYHKKLTRLYRRLLRLLKEDLAQLLDLVTKWSKAALLGRLIYIVFDMNKVELLQERIEWREGDLHIYIIPSLRHYRNKLKMKGYIDIIENQLDATRHDIHELKSIHREQFTQLERKLEQTLHQRRRGYDCDVRPSQSKSPEDERSRSRYSGADVYTDPADSRLRARSTQSLGDYGDVPRRALESRFHDEATIRSRHLIMKLLSPQVLDTERYVEEWRHEFDWDLQRLPKVACKFLLKQEGFIEWNHSSSPILVVTGGRGTGKYLATSFLADHLIQNRKRGITLWYGIPSWKERSSDSMSAKRILRCLVSSLIFQCPDVFNRICFDQRSSASLVRIFKDANRSSDAQPMSQIFSVLIAYVKRLDIVIDGADTTPDRHILVSSLVKIMSRSRNWRQEVRLLIGDQLDYHVRNVYGKVQKIDLRVGDIDCDVNSYVSNQLNLHLPDRVHRHPELLKKIVIGSNGGIGWARHIISLLTSPQALSNDHKFSQYVDEASRGFESELGRRFDELKNTSTKRSYTLCVLILRRFVQSREWMSSRRLASKVVKNRDHLGESEDFTWSEAEVVAAAENLSIPGLELLVTGREEFYMPSTIRSYLHEQLPPTLPKVPPLWLAGDTCIYLDCHFGSISRGRGLQTKCNVHGDQHARAAQDTRMDVANDLMSLLEGNTG